MITVHNHTYWCKDVTSGVQLTSEMSFSFKLAKLVAVLKSQLGQY